MAYNIVLKHILFYGKKIFFIRKQIMCLELIVMNIKFIPHHNKIVLTVYKFLNIHFFIFKYYTPSIDLYIIYHYTKMHKYHY